MYLFLLALVFALSILLGNPSIAGADHFTEEESSRYKQNLDSELKDGTLSEPNYEGVKNLLAFTKLKIIAAGGIASLDHLKQMALSGVEAAIVGRALYTGDIKLREAIDELKYSDR